jgi:uncharacterized protein (DUF1778 family)
MTTTHWGSLKKGNWIHNRLYLSAHPTAISCGACPLFQQASLDIARALGAANGDDGPESSNGGRFPGDDGVDELVVDGFRLHLCGDSCFRLLTQSFPGTLNAPLAQPPQPSEQFRLSDPVDVASPQVRMLQDQTRGRNLFQRIAAQVDQRKLHLLAYLQTRVFGEPVKRHRHDQHAERWLRPPGTAPDRNREGNSVSRIGPAAIGRRYRGITCGSQCGARRQIIVFQVDVATQKYRLADHCLAPRVQPATMCPKRPLPTVVARSVRCTFHPPQQSLRFSFVESLWFHPAECRTLSEQGVLHLVVASEVSFVMSSDQRGLRTARLEARITPEQKAIIERAAAYEGQSVSDFVVHSVQESAKSVLREHETLRLNRRQSEALIRSLLDAPEPNAALREAARDYHRRVRQG